MKLKNIEIRVYQLLTEYPRARDNDYYLYAKYIDFFYPNLRRMFVCQALKSGKMPSFESVTRTRRLIQNKHPELRGTRSNIRWQKQEEYIKYGKL